MKKLSILPVLAALIAITAFVPQDAHATSLVAVNGDWAGQGLPANVAATDTVTIPLGITVHITTLVKSAGTVTVAGTLIIDGPNGALTITAGNLDVLSTGYVDNLNPNIPVGPPAQGLLNQGNLNNMGLIDNHGFFGDRGNTINTGTIRNYLHMTINNNFDNTEGIFYAECNSDILYRPGVSITGNQPIIVECHNTQIPEFPIPFGMIIIFAAVAAVYMGIRQKMIPGFKSF